MNKRFLLALVLLAASPACVSAGRFDKVELLLVDTNASSVAEAKLLRTIDRPFQVAGHTDDQPITVSPHASNWELSIARALAVTKLLIQDGTKASSLSAAGYGQWDPQTDELVVVPKS